MKKLALYALVSFVSSLSTFSFASEYELKMKSGNFTPEITLDFEKATEALDSEIHQDRIYRLIQFYDIPTNAQKKLILNAGIELISYIPNNAFICAIDGTISSQIAAHLNIRSILLMDATFKLSNELTKKELPDWVVFGNKVKVNVHYYSENDKLDILASLEQYGATIEHSIDEINTLCIQCDQSKLSQLANNPLIQWIEPISAPHVKDDTRGASSTRSNTLNTDYGAGRKYDGTGVVVALADDGTVGPHIDFEGRLTNYSTTNNGNHGDMTTGIFVGAGNLDPTIRGMASGAEINVYSVGFIGITGYPHIINGVANLNTLGTVITSTSYSQGNGGVYSTDAEYTDQQISENESMMHVFSAGNSGTLDHGYGAGAGWGNISGGAKAGKNVICSGNVDHLDALHVTSSRGPAADGRIKPDLCAQGVAHMSTDEQNTYQTGAGTSASSPTIAGVFTQLFQAYKELNGGVEPETALLKASLLNTAEDLGNPGPDFKFGWGRINGLKAIRIIEDNRYIRDSIVQGGANTHSIVVPANVSQVRIMTYWTDYVGNPAASVALVNDINMQVIDPLSVSYNPLVLDHSPNATSLNSNATQGIDSLNNVEQITIDTPTAGTYTINLSGNAIPQGPQKYYVVYDFIYDAVELTYPIGGEGFVPGEIEVLRWDAPNEPTNFSLEYSTDGGNTYSSINNSVPSTSRSFLWNVPNTLSGDVKVRINQGSYSSESDTTLTIVGVPQNVTIESVCPDSVQLSWNNVTGASSYEISMLGTRYMDSIGTSTTNGFVIYGLNPMEEHWFSVRAIVTGNKGRRAIAVYKAPGNQNCTLNDDVGISEILTPNAGIVSGCGDFSSYKISARLTNDGMASVSNVDLYYQLNGGAIISEVYPGPLAPGAAIDYTFSTTADLSSTGNYALSVWVVRSPDDNVYNDTLTSISEVLPGNIVSLPYTENFNSFPSCAVTANCGSTTCGLNNGWVNYDNYTLDDIDWRTDAGGTTSLNTGPTVDYDLGTTAGKYLYLEPSSNCYNRLATLLSPCIDLSNITEGTFEFAYHMYGTTVGELHVDVITENSIIEDVINPIIGNQGNSWVLASVDLAPFAGDTINFRIRGITGNGFYSDIAIDGISATGNLGLNDGTLSATSVIYYPVPSEGIIDLSIAGLETNQLEMTIMDINGRALLSEKHAVHGTKFTHTIDLSHFAKGTYLVRLNSSTGSRIDRIVVK